MELLLKYPLVERKLTEDNNVVLFEGQMFVHDQIYNLTLEETTTIDDSYKYILKKLHNEEPENLNQEINHILINNSFQNVLEVLDRINEFLELTHPSSILENHCDIYRKVLYEYTEFTKFFLNLKSCTLKDDLTKIFASILDEKRREHCIEISVDYTRNTQDIFQISIFDLPKKDQDLFKASDSLTALFDQFLAQVELLQPYFDVMEEFDRSCTILDPEKPRRQDAYRRIFLGENISTVITVDPYNIFMRPDIKFLGPDRLTEPFSTRLNENLGNWVCQNDIFQGVLDMLGLEQFPQCQTTKKGVDLLVEYGECSICFSLRLNEKLPEIICTNKSCEQFYHNQCLYDWLVSLNAKRVFNNISGNCPNCEKTITCPVLD